MKAIKLLLSFLILFTLVGCNGKKTINGEEFVIYDKHELPVVLGQPTLSNSDIDSLNDVNAFEKINTYGDVFVYLRAKQLTDKDEIINTCKELLYGDYDDLGIIETVNNSLFYVKVNDKYYPIDVVNYNETTWLANFNLTSFSYNSTAELENTFNGKVTSLCKDGYKLGDAPFIVFNGEKLSEYMKYGEPVYRYKGFEFPVALGYPQLTDEQLAQVSDGTAPAKIKTYADAIIYLAIKYAVIENKYMPADFEPIEDDLGDFGFLNTYLQFLYGDYAETGSIEMWSGSAANPGYCVFHIYLKADNGRYYWLDWYSNITRGNKEWLGTFLDWTFKGDHYSFESTDEIYNLMLDPDYNAMYNVHVPSMSVDFDYHMRKFSDETFVAPADDLQTHIITLPDGSTTESFYRLGTECFSYIGSQFPVGLGAPKLTDEYIDELIASKDYDRIAKEITTYVDMANYMYRAGFVFLSDDGSYGEKVFTRKRDDGWTYSASAKEIMKLRFGVCIDATCVSNYILQGDYEEIGMIDVRNTNDNGHAEIYIKCDGIYYLCNPSSQCFMDCNYRILDMWLKESTLYDITSSESLEELMNCFVNSNNPGSPNCKVKSCFTIVGDIDYCFKDGTGNTKIYPEGSKATAWTNHNVEYGKPKYDITSHGRVDKYGLEYLPEAIAKYVDYE